MNSTTAKAPVFCLMGPTAIGKTAVAVDLVQRFPLEIISVDSAQVYRELNIGTGKPDAETLQKAPHRLLDIIDPAQAYSASDFRRDALSEIEAVRTEGKIPLLVGGTMLYFKVLRDGLAALPRADNAVRKQIETLAATEGWERVHQRLQEVDPESAARIHPNDPQRLQRALEVYLVSGKTMTALHAAEQQDSASALPYHFHFMAILPSDRSALQARIAARFRQMLAQGFEEEVATLYERGDLNPQLPAIKSVGYRQMWQYIAGELDYDGMVEKSIIATRQLAKRQLTWLRSWQNLQGFSDSCTGSSEEALADLHNSQLTSINAEVHTGTDSQAQSISRSIAESIAESIESVLNSNESGTI